MFECAGREPCSAEPARICKNEPKDEPTQFPGMNRVAGVAGRARASDMARRLCLALQCYQKAYIFNLSKSIKTSARSPISQARPGIWHGVHRPPSVLNDLGRSVVQHKPLHKGENTQTSLAKTFDDPAMRPKVFHAPVVCVSRPPQPSLNIKDIEGAQPKVFAMGVQDKRDPRTQTYVPPAASHQLPPAGDPGPAAKDHIGVHDIEGTSSKPRCSALSTREACTMKSRDVERSHAGWRTEYRDQVPRHSETHDFQYNVSDINSYRPPKIKIIFQNPPQPAAPPPQPPPPPTTAQAPYTPPESSQSTLLHYTGLPTFQTRPDVLAEQQRVQKIADQPMMEVAAECRALAAGQQRDIRGIDMVVADAQALQKKKFTKDAHQARVSVSLTHKEEKAAALDALQHLNITEETGCPPGSCVGQHDS
eukprot:gene9434-4066_t